MVNKATVTLLGKEYTDITDSSEAAPVHAYIQCSWFSDKQIKFMEDGLTAIGQNLTVSLKYSHHPLSHQYKDINVNEHPEVMSNLEWQQNTFQMDMNAIYSKQLGIGLYMPSEIDDGQAYEQGVLNALHKPNVLVIPDDEKQVPMNLMVGCGNTQIITLSELANFNFHDIVFKPYSGKVF